jgi:hypothetical protein
LLGQKRKKGKIRKGAGKACTSDGLKMAAMGRHFQPLAALARVGK